MRLTWQEELYGLLVGPSYLFSAAEWHDTSVHRITKHFQIRHVYGGGVTQASHSRMQMNMTDPKATMIPHRSRKTTEEKSNVTRGWQILRSEVFLSHNLPETGCQRVKDFTYRTSWRLGRCVSHYVDFKDGQRDKGTMTAWVFLHKQKETTRVW